MIAALRWQVDSGADEAILDLAVDRFAEAVKAKAVAATKKATETQDTTPTANLQTNTATPPDPPAAGALARRNRHRQSGCTGLGECLQRSHRAAGGAGKI